MGIYFAGQHYTITDPVAASLYQQAADENNSEFAKIIVACLRVFGGLREATMPRDFVAFDEV